METATFVLGFLGLATVNVGLVINFISRRDDRRDRATARSDDNHHKLCERLQKADMFNVEHVRRLNESGCLLTDAQRATLNRTV